MAQRRKSTRKRTTTKRTKKEAEVTHELPGGFWRQIFALLMMALALFFVITWFGHGGSVLNIVDQFMVSAFGFGSRVFPALLV